MGLLKSIIQHMATITNHITSDVDTYDIPLSRPKPLANTLDLQHYRENCPHHTHPKGDCDNHCHASDYYYRKYPDGCIRGQWYCKASLTLEEFEPDYRKKLIMEKISTDYE